MKMHWPESAEFQPESEEHLRKYVLCRAGYYDTTDIAIEWAEDQPALTKLAGLSIESAIKAAGSFAFVRSDARGGRVRVFRAKSIAFHNLGQSPFNKLNDEVEAVYLSETGLDADTVLREHAS